jgi:hypothetical protein
MKTKTIRIAGRDYELKVWEEANSTFVQCFENGAPATARFSVTDDVRGSFVSQRGERAVEQLIRIAVGDLINASDEQ